MCRISTAIICLGKSKTSKRTRLKRVNLEYSNSLSPYLIIIKVKIKGDYWNQDIVKTSEENQKLDIKGEHPAPFSDEIITLPILQTSNEGNLVLDPFMGSGTVGKVCDQKNRSFVGYDIKIYG